MQNLNVALWKARVFGFFRDAGLYISFVVVYALSSPQFMELISANFGKGAFGGIALILVSAAISHLKNLSTIKRAQEKFGNISTGAGPVEPIILV